MQSSIDSGRKSFVKVPGTHVNGGKTLVLVGRWVGRENVCTNMENQFSSWG